MATPAEDGASRDHRRSSHNRSKSERSKSQSKSRLDRSDRSRDDDGQEKRRSGRSGQEKSRSSRRNADGQEKSRSGGGRSSSHVGELERSPRTHGRSRQSDTRPGSRKTKERSRVHDELVVVEDDEDEDKDKARRSSSRRRRERGDRDDDESSSDEDKKERRRERRSKSHRDSSRSQSRSRSRSHSRSRRRRQQEEEDLEEYERQKSRGQDPPQKVDPNEVGFLRKGFNQNIVAGIVAFTGPGLFNAMQGLGNAGGSDPKVAATMNATLYATFSIFGILSGSLFNLLGTKILMSFGALTYGFYAISVYLWGQVDDSYAGMAIFASAILGLGAACLWGAQGTMTLSYAMENQKGLFFGIFWLIFNMGGVMGGFIAFGVNSGESGGSSVTPETYFTFCGLMVTGAVLAFIFVISPSRVVKADGSAVVFEQTDSADGLGELKEVAKLFTNRYMLLLTPLIIQSNWFYAYEFGGINGLLFDAPTRGLNSAVYWGISGVSSYVCGTYYLDQESFGGRRQRAIRGLTMISAVNVGQWVYAICYQFSTGYDKGNAPDPPINYRDGGAYAAPMILFMYCGLADSLVQTYAYWIIGAISNSPKTLSRYVGYYKGIQSFGACLAWIIEAEGASYRAQLMICATLAVIFIPPTYMVASCVQDQGSDTEIMDLKDEDNESVRNKDATMA